MASSPAIQRRTLCLASTEWDRGPTGRMTGQLTELAMERAGEPSRERNPILAWLRVSGPEACFLGHTHDTVACPRSSTHRPLLIIPYASVKVLSSTLLPQTLLCRAHALLVSLLPSHFSLRDPGPPSPSSRSGSDAHSFEEFPPFQHFCRRRTHRSSASIASTLFTHPASSPSFPYEHLTLPQWRQTSAPTFIS